MEGNVALTSTSTYVGIMDGTQPVETKVAAGDRGHHCQNCVESRYLFFFCTNDHWFGRDLLYCRRGPSHSRDACVKHNRNCMFFVPDTQWTHQ